MATRRAVLAMTGTLTASAFAGCTTDGENPFLKLESGLDEPVSLSIVVRQAKTNSVTSEGQYEVPARSVRRLEVLGNDRYKVTATAPFDSVTFETEPTCRSATSAVFVTPDQGLNAAVQRCPET
jgi:hypothetical protein